MKGIEYVVDDRGEKKAVLIDLSRFGELWEDFYDSLLAEARKDEPRETLEEVRAKLGLEGG
jgi:PHD/YefM family antitoxin component YafN of YafNO toxin-antitoxin module